MSTETIIKTGGITAALALICAVVLGACTAPAPELGNGSAALLAGESRDVFLTYGYDNATGPRPLMNDDALGLWIGRADHELGTDESIVVTWKQGGGVATVVNWAEVAIGTGAIEVGSTPITIVGFENVTTLVQQAGTIKLKITLAHPVQPRAGLWLVFAANAPMSGSWRPWGAVPIENVATGLVVANRIPGWRPSAALDLEATFDLTAPVPKAVSAAVLVP